MFSISLKASEVKENTSAGVCKVLVHRRSRLHQNRNPSFDPIFGQSAGSLRSNMLLAAIGALEERAACPNTKARLQQTWGPPTNSGAYFHAILPISIRRSPKDNARRGRSPKRGRKYPAPAGDS